VIGWPQSDSILHDGRRGEEKGFNTEKEGRRHRRTQGKTRKERKKKDGGIEPALGAEIETAKRKDSRDWLSFVKRE